MVATTRCSHHFFFWYRGIYIKTPPPFIKNPPAFFPEILRNIFKKNSIFSARSGNFLAFLGKFTSKNQAKMLLKLTSKTQAKFPKFVRN